MIKKNIDQLFIGKNYLSFIKAIQCAKNDCHSLILDASQVNLGDTYKNHLSLLQVLTLKELGHTKELEPLFNLDVYLSGSYDLYVAGSTQLLLGSTPSSNVNELLRKVPSFFNSSFEYYVLEENREHFDESFSRFISGIASLLLKKSYPSYKELAALCPKQVIELFAIFSQKYFDGDVDVVRFSRGMRTFYSHRLSYSTSKEELFLLFTEMLSPKFLIDEDRILSDLKDLYESYNGELLRASVEKIECQSGKISSCELSSYDGIVFPSLVHIFGSRCDNVGVHVGTNESYFRSLIVDVPIINHSFESFGPLWVNFNQGEDVHSHVPFFIAFIQEKTLKIYYPVEDSCGLKEEFFQKRIKDEVLPYILSSFSYLEVDRDDIRFQLSSDLWLKDSRPFSSDLKRNWKKGAIKVKGPTVGRPAISAKNLLYSGQKIDDASGLITILRELYHDCPN